MIEFGVDFITGVMVGLEFPTLGAGADDLKDEDGNDLKFGIVLDLFILRFTLFFWKEA